MVCPQRLEPSVAAHSLVSINHSDSRIHLKIELTGCIQHVDDKILNYLLGNGPIAAEDIACANHLASNFTDGWQILQTAPSESETYAPLETLLNAILNYDGYETIYKTSKKYERCFTRATGEEMTSQTSAVVPGRLPDLALVDLQYKGEPVTKPVSWLRTPLIVEVKPKQNQGPQPSNTETVKEIMPQAADYARLHLSLRPFQVFSYILLIHGMYYSITYFDRTGALVSREYSLMTELTKFVALVRRLGTELSLYDFGMDPTVKLSDGFTMFSVPYPSFDVYVGGQAKYYTSPPCSINKDYWTTKGSPTWQSLSFVGRGTSTWLAIDCKGQQHVLKNLWRDAGRETETRMYRRLLPECKGVARFAMGGDVVDKNTGETITSDFLRDTHGKLTCQVNCMIQHRLVLLNVGNPIWRYDSPLEFVQAMKDAIEGHRNLFEKERCLHRDISTGNVLISLDPTAERGAYGFIADIELSKLFEWNNSGQSVPTETDAFRPDMISGTAQFMAVELLKGMINQKPVVQGVHHVLESFIWVTLYAILLNELYVIRGTFLSGRQRNPDPFKIVEDLFGHTNYQDILAARLMGTSTLYEQYLPLIKDSILQQLIIHLLDLAGNQARRSPNAMVVPITYDAVLKPFNEAIESLKNK